MWLGLLSQMTLKRLGIIFGILTAVAVVLIVLLVGFVALFGGMAGVPWANSDDWVLIRNGRDSDAMAIVSSALPLKGFEKAMESYPVRVTQRESWWRVPARGSLLIHVGPRRFDAPNVRSDPFFLVHFVARTDVTNGYPSTSQPQLDQPTPAMGLHEGSWVIDLQDDPASILQSRATTHRYLDAGFRAAAQDAECESKLPPPPAQ